MAIHFSLGLQQGPVLDSFKKIVHEWNIEHVDAEVELKEYTDYGQPAKEALEKPENEQPSLVLAPEFMTGKMMEAFGKKKILPIGSLLEKESLSDIAEIVKRTFGDKEGNLVSLPFNPACGVIYTNKTLLKAMGKDPNWTPKSIEELEEVSQLLVDKKLVEAGYTFAWPPAYSMEVPAAQVDFPLVQPENGKLGYGKYQFSAEWLTNHMLALRTQQKRKIFLYAGQTNDAKKPFVEGKVAFFMQGSTHLPLLQKDAKFEVGCGALPTLLPGQKEKYAFPLGGAAIWVLNNAQTQKMLDGVRGFLNYLASKKIQERWHKETGYVPVRASIAKDLQEFYKDHPLHKAVFEQTIGARLGKYSFGIGAPNYAEARKELFDVIEKILSEKTTDEEVKTLLKEFDKKYTARA